MRKVKGLIQIKYLKHVVFISFLSLVVGYLYRRPSYFQSLLQMNASQFFYLSGPIVLTFIINGISLRVMLVKFNIPLQLKECFGLAMANTMGNYLFTKAGSVANSYYLKKRYDLPISSFIAMLGAIQITNLSVISLTGLLLAVTLVAMGNKTVIPLLIIYVVILMCVILGIAFFDRMKKIRSSNKMLSFIVDILQSWSIIRKDKVCLAVLALLGLAGTLLFSFRLLICYQIIGKPISYLFCILLATLVHISTLANVIPANIGLREGVVGLASVVIGSSFESGFFATTVDRIVSMFWIFSLGGLVILFFLNRKEMSQEEDTP